MADDVNIDSGQAPVIIQQDGAMQQNVLVDAKGEHWVYSYWRPLMAWQYMAVCIFDFILAPIMFTIYSGVTHAATLQIWHPISLEGGGLYHLAMGAVLGITSWSRGQEKIKELQS